MAGRRLVLQADPPGGAPVHGALIGRAAELATLHRLRMTINGPAVVIGADAGGGKSALLSALAGDARRDGVAVVEGACVEIETRRPFGVFADVISACARAFGPARVARSLQQRGVEIAQLMSPAAPRAGERAGDRYQMHAAITGLLAELTSDGPLVVALEDLHWADEASLELFGYLARRLRGHAVFLVATYRTDELDRRHPLRLALADLRRSRLIEDLPLGPLDLDGTAALIQARLALRDPAVLDLREFRDLVHARCEGNPLHTEETLDTLRRAGRLTYVETAWVCDSDDVRDAIPAVVADAVVSRWAGLTAAARQVVLVASVIGHRFDLDLLAAVSATPMTELAPLIHEAIEARLVLDEVAGQPLSFRHALTREALRHQLLRAERVALHGRIAAVLARRARRSPGPALAVNPAELAYHLEESGNAAEASPHYLAAARQAAAVSDYAGASRLMEQAIATDPHHSEGNGDRELALAGYLSISGDDARAARAATAALDAAERSGDVPAQARSLIHLWTGTNRNSDVHRDHSHLQRAFALLEPLGPTPELASVCAFMAGASARDGDGTAAIEFAERARAMARGLGLPPQLAAASLNLSIGRYVQGDLTSAIEACREAIEIAEQAALVQELYGALMTLGIQLMAVGDPAEELRGVRSRLRAIAKAHGPGRQDWLTRELSWLHSDGDWDEFLELASQVPDPARPDFEVPRRMVMFTAVARTGRRAPGSADTAALRDVDLGSAPAALWSAELLFLEERYAEAVALAAAVEDKSVTRTFWGLIPATTVHTIGLFAARECGDVVAHDRFIDSLLTARPIPVNPSFNRRAVAIAHAAIAEREGRIEDALAAYAVARAECERDTNGQSVLISILRQRMCELFLLRTPRDVPSAQAEFDAALGYWQKAKAIWYLGQLRTWAERRGLTVAHDATPAARPASGALTRREWEVARLVAAGLTNREIALRLTLSVRTAESHLEQIRGKLGLRSRSQVTAWVIQRYGPTS